MLLKTMVNSASMGTSFGNSSINIPSVLNQHLCRNSFISTFAIGSGGVESGTVIPNASKFTDICLNKMLPMISTGNNILANTATAKMFVYAEKEQLTGIFKDGENEALNIIDNAYSNYDSANIYFKRIGAVSGITQAKISKSLAGANASYCSSVVTLTLEVSGSQLIYPSNSSTVHISEIGLYLGALKINDYTNKTVQGAAHKLNISLRYTYTAE